MISESTVRGNKIRASRLISRPILRDFDFDNALLFCKVILRQKSMIHNLVNFCAKIQPFDTATHKQKKWLGNSKNKETDAYKIERKNDDIFSHRFRNFSSQAMSHFRSAFLRIC